MDRKNLLLIGATGFVGANLARQLLRAGHNLCCLIRTDRHSAREFLSSVSSSAAAAGRHHGKPSRVDIVAGDITKPGLGLQPQEAQRLLQETDEVWHCAAMLNFEDRKRLETRQVNYHGTQNVLEFVRASQAHRFHYLSTAYVVGRRRGRFPETFPDKAEVFKNTYEQTKWLAENLIKAQGLGRHQSATIYRPSVVMGEAQPGKVGVSGLYAAARIIAAVGEKYGLTQTGNSHHSIRIPGDRACALNLVPIDYVVQAAAAIAASPLSPGKIFHLVNPVPTPNEEVIGALSDALDLRISLANPQDFAAAPMRPYEKLINQTIKRYLPYLHDSLSFDDANTRTVLAGAHLACPPMDRVRLAGILAYYRQNNLVHDLGVANYQWSQAGVSRRG